MLFVTPVRGGRMLASDTFCVQRALRTQNHGIQLYHAAAFVCPQKKSSWDGQEKPLDVWVAEKKS